MQIVGFTMMLVSMCKMKHRWSVFLVITNAYAADLSNDELRLYRTREHCQKKVLECLRPALKSVGGAARIDYETACFDENAQRAHFLALPCIEVQRAPAHKRGLAATRDVFKNDKNVAVTTARSGMIRITIGHPASEILQTRIGLLKFDPSEQYTPLLAIRVIPNAKEVQVAVKKLGLELPVLAMSIGVNEPVAGLPHLPRQLRNVTIEEVLDLIARTFQGISVYGVCATQDAQRYFWLNFIEVVDAPAQD